MIKRLAKWILRDDENLIDLLYRLEGRITYCEQMLKNIQRVESKCDTNKRQHEILQSKFVTLLNKVNNMDNKND